MATRALSPAFVRPLGARPATVLALALPPLFLHAEHQPGLSLGVADTSVEVRLSDVAVLAVLAAAALAWRRHGAAPLRRALPLWLPLAALCAWVGAAALYGPAVLDGYPLWENVVTAAKVAEYALLAPAVALLVRDREDVRQVAIVLVAWSALATLVGAAQVLGLDVFAAGTPGQRQPSLLGHHDFAALSGAALVLALAALVLERRLLLVPVAAGALGLVIAAPLAGVLGLVLATAGIALLARRRRPYPVRRLAAAAALVVAVAAGTVAMRAESVAAFLDFLVEDRPTTEIETYSHRTLLMYIGARIFADHPVIGVGLRGSEEPAAFEPYLADARERFPDAAPLAFPAEGREYGTQSLYVQTLADLGLVGFALLAALAAGAAVLARRALGTTAGVLGVLWLLLVAGLWSAQGLVGGLPLGALTFVALGLVASGAARR